MIAGNGMNVPETVMGRQSYMHWCWILLLILAMGNEWNMHGTRARLLLGAGLVPIFFAK
jgi:hypothetical protein